MSYRCPTCHMKFNRKEHAKCGRCPAPIETTDTMHIPCGEFWPKPAEPETSMESNKDE